MRNSIFTHLNYHTYVLIHVAPPILYPNSHTDPYPLQRLQMDLLKDCAIDCMLLLYTINLRQLTAHQSNT